MTSSLRNAILCKSNRRTGVVLPPLMNFFRERLSTFVTVARMFRDRYPNPQNRFSSAKFQRFASRLDWESTKALRQLQTLDEEWDGHRIVSSTQEEGNDNNVFVSKHQMEWIERAAFTQRLFGIAAFLVSDEQSHPCWDAPILRRLSHRGLAVLCMVMNSERRTLSQQRQFLRITSLDFATLLISVCREIHRRTVGIAAAKALARAVDMRIQHIGHAWRDAMVLSRRRCTTERFQGMLNESVLGLSANLDRAFGAGVVPFRSYTLQVVLRSVTSALIQLPATSESTLLDRACKLWIRSTSNKSGGVPTIAATMALPQRIVVALSNLQVAKTQLVLPSFLAVTRCGWSDFKVFRSFCSVLRVFSNFALVLQSMMVQAATRAWQGICAALVKMLEGIVDRVTRLARQLLRDQTTPITKEQVPLVFISVLTLHAQTLNAQRQQVTTLWYQPASPALLRALVTLTVLWARRSPLSLDSARWLKTLTTMSSYSPRTALAILPVFGRLSSCRRNFPLQSAAVLLRCFRAARKVLHVKRRCHASTFEFADFSGVVAFVEMLAKGILVTHLVRFWRNYRSTFVASNAAFPSSAQAALHELLLSVKSLPVIVSREIRAGCRDALRSLIERGRGLDAPPPLITPTSGDPDVPTPGDTLQLLHFCASYECTRGEANNLTHDGTRDRKFTRLIYFVSRM